MKSEKAYTIQEAFEVMKNRMLKTLEEGSKKETVPEGLGISDERVDEISEKCVKM